MSASTLSLLRPLRRAPLAVAILLAATPVAADPDVDAGGERRAELFEGSKCLLALADVLVELKLDVFGEGVEKYAIDPVFRAPAPVDAWVERTTC